MDDKDLIKKMKRNLRKGTRRKNRQNNGVLLPDCFLLFFCSFAPFIYFKEGKTGNVSLKRVGLRINTI